MAIKYDITMKERYLASFYSTLSEVQHLFKEQVRV